RRLLALFGEGSRAGQMLEAVEAFEETMGPGAAGMHDALGDALMVEVGDLLAENEVLEQRRSADPRLERGLVIRDQHTLVGGQRPLGRRRALLVQSAVLILAILDRAGPAGLGIAVHLTGRTGRSQVMELRRPRARRRRTGRVVLTGFGVVVRHAAGRLSHQLRLLYRRPVRLGWRGSGATIGAKIGGLGNIGTALAFLVVRHCSSPRQLQRYCPSDL